MPHPLPTGRARLGEGVTRPGAAEQVAVELARVPETMLWTLYHRAVEARRADAVLDDPKAVELVERIDYPFRERFGSGEGFSQWQALRARCFDLVVAALPRAAPGRERRGARRRARDAVLACRQRARVAG